MQKSPCPQPSSREDFNIHVLVVRRRNSRRSPRAQERHHHSAHSWTPRDQILLQQPSKRRLTRTVERHRPVPPCEVMDASSRDFHSSEIPGNHEDFAEQSEDLSPLRGGVTWNDELTAPAQHKGERFEAWEDFRQGGNALCHSAKIVGV